MGATRPLCAARVYNHPQAASSEFKASLETDKTAEIKLDSFIFHGDGSGPLRPEWSRLAGYSVLRLCTLVQTGVLENNQFSEMWARKIVGILVYVDVTGPRIGGHLALTRDNGSIGLYSFPSV